MSSVPDRRSDLDYEGFVAGQWTGLYRTAFLMTGDHQRAEDVVQTALMKVYLAWPRVAAMKHPEAYTRTIMLNQLISWWRRRSSTESPTLTLVEPVQPAFDDRVVQARAIWSHVLSLPPRQRAVVVLRYYEDRSETEIAAILGISTGSVKTHSHHALARLRSRLSESVGDALVDGGWDERTGRS